MYTFSSFKYAWQGYIKVSTGILLIKVMSKFCGVQFDNAQTYFYFASEVFLFFFYKFKIVKKFL